MDQKIVILNPVAGNGKGITIRKDILGYIERNNLDAELVLSEYPGHTERLAEEYSDNLDILVAAGGDGTINEIINGYSFVNGTVLGILPVGSGNDFAKSAGVKGKVSNILDSIFNNDPKILSVNVGKARLKTNTGAIIERKFINTLGIGFDARVGFLKNSSDKGPAYISYAKAIIKALKNYYPLKVTITADSFSLTGNKMFVTVGNGKASGGGLYLTPDADLEDDLLDISVIDFIGRLKLVTKIPKVLIKKTTELKEVYADKIKKCNIKLSQPDYVHLDGEVFEGILELDIELSDKKIKVISNWKK